MKILFLGTGAADWKHKKEKDDIYYRRFSSVLIDDRLLIDPGPKVIEAIKEYNVDISRIEFIIYTHKHSDHYSEETVKILKQNGTELIEIKAGDNRVVDQYSICAVRGNHPVETCHFIIDDGKSKMFYGMDGGWLMYDEVQEIIRNRPIDLAVLDGTVGFKEGDWRIFEHNNLNMVIELKKTLSAHINRFCVNHIAYTLHDNHTVLAEKMQKFGIETAYDGLVLRI